eukprot:CAMPEP_0170318060 /NCGR_PEP_ID=MMETSP0116_2-20130129/59712_1 /TAXON_ID=400756 /ORGANISM="Durinskia baltica, Strain CSIRO CS-38" /LENGTH=437 /DNA_ID=CAMNT_0010570727 /DNA_START=84 /DNA_END=1394 /DNA_ORIENTATION=+
MINYDGQSWFDLLLRWQGTVLPGIWKRALIVFVYMSMTYVVQVSLECNFGFAWSHSFIVGQSLSFLLVFRANASYLKYQAGRFICAHFFSSLRNLAMLCCALFNGGHGQYVWNRRHNADGFTEGRRAGLDDSFDARASQSRADIVRWSLALAIAFRMAMSLGAAQFSSGEIDEALKWRINFSRMRMRTLLSKEEFILVDKALKVEDSGEEWRLLWLSGKSEPQVFHQCTAPTMPGGKYLVSTEPCVRQVLLILFFLGQSVRLHANEPYGYKERFLPTFNTIITHLNGLHDQICQAMTSPLPLPYVSLVRTLMLAYLFSLPFFINYADGILANVVNPTLLAIALLGIDQIGTELENPFGDDPNDLDIQALIMGLEKELLRTLEIAGDVRARDMFTWLPVPRFMQRETASRARRAGAQGGAGGVRVRHVELEPTPLAAA